MFFATVLCMICAGGVGGCGPISATTAVAEATVAIENARAVEAERYAVYEFVRAVEHLKKAKEEEGFSDFQGAIDLADMARGLAEAAKARALSSPSRGVPDTSDAPDDVPLSGPASSGSRL